MEEENIKQPAKNSKTAIIIIMGVIIVALSILCVLFAADVIAFNTNSAPTREGEEAKTNCQVQPSGGTNNPDTPAANTTGQKSTVSTSQILSYYKQRVTAGTDKEQLYSVTDINGDDIPELFMHIYGTIGDRIVSDIMIFTYDENKGDKNNNYIIGIGTIGGNNTNLYKMNDGRLLAVSGHMGYESAAYYKLENDWLVRTEVSFRQIDNADYLKGDEGITVKPISDTSLIDNYK